MERVSERIEEADVLEASKICKLVKEKFVALVEGRFLQRVKPLNQPLVIATHCDHDAGGVTRMALDLRFDLPPNVDGELNLSTVLHLVMECFVLALAIKYESRKRQREAESGDEPRAKRSKKSVSNH